MMKAVLARYLNEIVGLAVMALMVVALVAGQAQATLKNDAAAPVHATVEVSLGISD